MHAVVTRAKLRDFEQGRKFLREQAIPRIKQAPGFVSAQWVRLDDGSGIAMLTFESEDDAKAAVEQIKATPPPADAVTVEGIDIGEVVERVEP